MLRALARQEHDEWAPHGTARGDHVLLKGPQKVESAQGGPGTRAQTDRTSGHRGGDWPEGPLAETAAEGTDAGPATAAGGERGLRARIRTA